MKTLFIYGLDTVAGANIAHTLSEQYNIVGVAENGSVEIPGCQILSGAAAKSPPTLLSDLRPDLVLDASCCGDSVWNPQARIGQEDQCRNSLERASASAKLQIPFTFLSSDAVLTGPWMFHEENSTDYCDSAQGQRLLKLEQAIQQACPQVLILRTHPFGWNSFNSNSANWMESLLSRMAAGRPCSELNQPGYATPLLATELAAIVDRALSESLTGIYHVAGAERVSRLQFARRLAEFFQVSSPQLVQMDNRFTQSDRKNFSCGESSLQTRAIRRELGVGMPTLSESLQTLVAQQDSITVSSQHPELAVAFSRAA